MDRHFLSYYESELAHIRELAVEFAALHPVVAQNLSLTSVPCPDPYVERLLEGVAWLAARTRYKVEAESTLQVRNLLDALYPDLVGPAPAMSTVVLHPGPQVQTMPQGHVVRRGTQMTAAFREGLATRATYATAQDVTLWPVAIDSADYLPDRGAIKALRLPDAQTAEAEAAIRLVLRRAGPGALAELSLDRLDVNFAGGAASGAIFDAVFGAGGGVCARPEGGAWHMASPAAMLGLADTEALLPRLRPAFEGYRLLREYFLMPERFHFLRLSGLNPALRAASGKVEILLPLTRPAPGLADLSASAFRLFATPVVNLFEKECGLVELDPRRTAHVVHADRARPLDFEIYRLLNVEDAEAEGPEARLHQLHAMDQMRGSGLVYTTERRSRRPTEDELRRGQTRTSHAGSDLYISVARLPGGAEPRAVRRLDIRALCTNRDLPILDDQPRLTPETGDPLARIELIAPLRRPRPALQAGLPRVGQEGEAVQDDLAWRLVGQLALNHLSLAEENRNAEPLRALLDLYADRGDPALTRHARAITRVSARTITERLGLPGPLCFGRGVEITLTLDEAVLSGGAELLLPALLSQLFARHAGINSFVRCKTRLSHRQQEVAWPMTPGIRAPI
ncbi:type VI secretion protein [Gemmobacter aquaticus]|uniref:Type VI secretion protein n=1 Tax=Gemmobacter aquaticus TaxID=490185 RepID=A0A917YPX3_9RHOB|nr:type VI secretion system baseplate subunit TssF [Gemmobacter aquaticus]GGO36933.1 type VI secretion protein [Gemmobacter aquaticus]